MTPLAYVVCSALLAWAVSYRVRAVRAYRAELKRRKPAPVVTQPYQGAIPKPLTPAQLKAVQERREFLAREKYKANKYLG